MTADALSVFYWAVTKHCVCGMEVDHYMFVSILEKRSSEGTTHSSETATLMTSL